jgi:hypothetical protein
MHNLDIGACMCLTPGHNLDSPNSNKMRSLDGIQGLWVDGIWRESYRFIMFMELPWWCVCMASFNMRSEGLFLIILLGDTTCCYIIF